MAKRRAPSDPSATISEKRVSSPRNQQSRTRRLLNGGGVFVSAQTQECCQFAGKFDNVSVTLRRDANHLD
jgi:hypothetical protein